jgi:Gylcosyl hydrolase family 115 C-terminal domain/Viral BACON domain
MAVAVEGAPFVAAGPFPRLALAAFDDFNRQTRWIDVFDRGNQPFSYTATADQAWIHLSRSSGQVTEEQRLLVSVDWASVPKGEASGSIEIRQKDGPAVTVDVQAFNPASPARDSVRGFFEANHLVSINAEHFTGRTDAGDVRWDKIPDFGETLSGMTIFPVTAASVEPPQPAATLEYRMYLFDSGKCAVQAILAPTNNFVPGRGLRYAISFDDQPAQVVDALADTSQKAWEEAVSDGVRKVTATLTIDRPGYHTLKFRMVDPGVVLEKLVVGFAEPAPRFPGFAGANRPIIPESYLGPPESYYRMTSSSEE